MNLKNQCLLLLSQTLQPALLRSKYTQPAVFKLTGRLVESGWAHLGAQVRMISPSGSISRSHHMKIASTVPSTCDPTLTSELSRFFSAPGWLKSNLRTQPSLPDTQHLSALSAQLSLNWTLSGTCSASFLHVALTYDYISPHEHARYKHQPVTTVNLWTLLAILWTHVRTELMDTAGNSVNSCQNWTYGHCWQLFEPMSELNLWTLLAILWTHVRTELMDIAGSSVNPCQKWTYGHCWQFCEPMSALYRKTADNSMNSCQNCKLLDTALLTIPWTHVRTVNLGYLTGSAWLFSEVFDRCNKLTWLYLVRYLTGVTWLYSVRYLTGSTRLHLLKYLTGSAWPFSEAFDRCNMTVFGEVLDRYNMTVFSEVFYKNLTGATWLHLVRYLTGATWLYLVKYWQVQYDYINEVFDRCNMTVFSEVRDWCNKTIY